MKKVVLFLIGLTLIYLLLLKGDIKSIVASMAELKLSVLCFLCLLQLATILLLIIQWVSLAKPIIPKIKYSTMLSIQMVGTLVESITPAAKTGGEAIKAILLKKQFQTTYSTAAALITVQKMFSMFAFIPISFISIVYLLLSDHPLSLELMISFIVITLIVAVLMLLVFQTNQLKKWLQQKSTKWNWPKKLSCHIDTFETSIKQLLQTKQNWLSQLLLSFIIWILFPIKAYLISMSMQLDVNFLTISSITFLAYMVAMLPLTPGGLGTFEGSVVLLLSVVQVETSEALVFAIILRFVTFWFVFLLSMIYSSYLYLNKKSRKHYFEFSFKNKGIEKFS